MKRTATAQGEPIRRGRWCQLGCVTLAPVNDAAALSETMAPPATGWSAALDLRYELRGERTVLAHRRHHGPLCVQRSLYPEGNPVCQSVIVHPPGGIVGGDELALSVEIGAGAHVQLTTPGATRWYRSTGARARQSIAVCVYERGIGEWLPQEAIVFDGAISDCEIRVELAEGASWLGWDIFCLGRRAAGERFGHGRLRQRLELFRRGVPVWMERAVLEAGTSCFAAKPGLGSKSVFGTLLAACESVPDELLSSCRALVAFSGEVGVTRLPGLLVARYLGDSAEVARNYFTAIWALARPAVLGRAAVMPRIWST